MRKRRKVRFLTDISFTEISGVDKPANDLATVQAIRVAKRANGETMNSFLKGAMRHILTIPRAGARPMSDLYKNRAPKFGPTIASVGQLVEFMKSATSNSEHLANAAKHLDRVGAHLRTAKNAHTDDENLASAVQHHRLATSFLRKIDLAADQSDARFGPEGQDAIANLPNPSGVPEAANDSISHAAGSRPDPDAFGKAFRTARRDGRRVLSFR